MSLIEPRARIRFLPLLSFLALLVSLCALGVAQERAARAEAPDVTGEPLARSRDSLAAEARRLSGLVDRARLAERKATTTANELEARGRAAGIDPENPRDPLAERLRGAMAPHLVAARHAKQEGDAYQALLDRTLAALEPTNPPPEPPVDPPVDPPPGGGGPDLPPAPDGPAMSPDQLVIPMPSQERSSQWGFQFAPPAMADEWHHPPFGQQGSKHALLNMGSVVASRLAPLTVSGLWFDGDYPRSNSIRWGGIAHGAADWTFEGCLFKDIGDEHGTYCKSCWTLKYIRCRFEEIGSQGIQVVWRDWEAEDPNACLNPNGDGTPSLILVQECVMLEVGQPTGGRPSYDLSIFERQPFSTGINRTVHVDRSWFEASKYENYEVSGGPYNSYGAIMVHGQGDVILDETVVRFLNPNRAIVQIWNCNSVTIRGGYYMEGLLDLRNIGTPGDGIPDVILQDVEGGANIQVVRGDLYTPPSPSHPDNGNMIVLHSGSVTTNASID